MGTFTNRRKNRSRSGRGGWEVGEEQKGLGLERRGGMLIVVAGCRRWRRQLEYGCGDGFLPRERRMRWSVGKEHPSVFEQGDVLAWGREPRARAVSIFCWGPQGRKRPAGDAKRWACQGPSATQGVPAGELAAVDCRQTGLCRAFATRLLSCWSCLPPWQPKGWALVGVGERRRILSRCNVSRSPQAAPPLLLLL